ncbi:cytochrome b [Thermochromatium tepidum]|uniref:Cytochrome b n=1 Tax=Thermochromatium tepidum ATCC 43061 TaxID=316276 RepID=A0A6I6E434_THETI|nr:cytochrome b/b6 domain-containing protein [Thermochromatium tepidum]QGU32512.1 cytochrome b [Thermochromatium tepidum ATCC 43061]
MTINRYTFTQRLLHWLIVALVFGMLLGGLSFWALGYEGLERLAGPQVTANLFLYHKSIGILVLALTLVRLWLRRRTPPPPYDPPLTVLERLVSGVTMVLLYLLSLAVPIGGALATSAAGYPVQFFGLELPGLLPENKQLGETLFLYHGLGALALALVVLVHMAAGIKHWRLKDGVMTRISLP